ncbi:hypothetical protein KY092_05415 [Natronomonas gomsonensis]|uniref:hypothetical protein n=1 Tax=Natronomonas gomsonensis TaxID=1046043 RepID=UPI0020CA3C44|nr:hypothetical protein [Natronomonas gomsonensis]MCY4729995.1 hypothetical protein [Natronomonas gomsonensis]
MDSDEFAKEVIAESNRRGKELAEKVFDADDTITGDDLIPMLKGFMWSEFYLGVIPPMRVMSMMYDGAYEIDVETWTSCLAWGTRFVTRSNTRSSSPVGSRSWVGTRT